MTNPTGKPQGALSAILEQLTEVKSKVDESLQQGRENGSELKLLRRELGLDGQHGRLPIVEATLLRYERRMEKTDLRLNLLEKINSEANGKTKLLVTALGLLGGGTGGAVIALIAHLFGTK